MGVDMIDDLEFRRNLRIKSLRRSIKMLSKPSLINFIFGNPAQTVIDASKAELKSWERSIEWDCQ